MAIIDNDVMILNCVSLCKIAQDAAKRYGLESLQAITAYNILAEGEDIIRRGGLWKEYSEITESLWGRRNNNNEQITEEARITTNA